jgi:hypothetical protein
MIKNRFATDIIYATTLKYFAISRTMFVHVQRPFCDGKQNITAPLLNLLFHAAA